MCCSRCGPVPRRWTSGAASRAPCGRRLLATGGNQRLDEGVEGELARVEHSRTATGKGLEDGLADAPAIQSDRLRGGIGKAGSLGEAEQRRVGGAQRPEGDAQDGV